MQSEHAAEYCAIGRLSLRSAWTEGSETVRPRPLLWAAVVGALLGLLLSQPARAQTSGERDRSLLCCSYFA